MKTPSITKVLLSALLPLVLLAAGAGAQANATTSATLAKDTQIPLVIEGKTVGSMTLKAGSQVTITQILPNNAGVVIARGESATAKLPNEAITPESLQAAIASQTAELTAQENEKATALAAAQATPVPTPTSTPMALNITVPPATATNSEEDQEEFCKKVLSLIVNKGIRPNIETYDGSNLGPQARAVLDCTYVPDPTPAKPTLDYLEIQKLLSEKGRPIEYIKKGYSYNNEKFPILKRIIIEEKNKKILIAEFASKANMGPKYHLPITQFTPESIAAALSNWP